MSVGLSFGSPTKGAGFDVSATVSSIMANLQNVETPWKDQISTINSQDTVLSSLGTLLSKLSTDISALTEATGVLSEKTGSSSDTNVLTLTSASTTAVAGDHSIQVSNLATTSSGYLTELAGASDTLSGSIVIQVGSGSTQTVTLTSSNNTLSGLAAAINSAGIGVSASVLSDANGARLSIVSGTSGANGNITVTSSINDTTDSNMPLSYTSAVTGVNASLTVDGVSLTTSSNSVTDLIPGVTFQLLATSTSPVQVVIANYNTGVESSIGTLVTDYNSLISTMNEQEGQDVSGNNEPLYGSPTLNMLQQDIMGSINTVNPSGNLTTISAASALDTTLSGSIVIQMGTGTAQTITLTSSNNTLSGLVSAVNSAGLGVTAAVVTANGSSTVTLASQVSGAKGRLAITSALKSSVNSPLSFTGTAFTSTTSAYGTLGTVSDTTDQLTGSVIIKVGTATAQTITINSSNNTLTTLEAAINSADLGVTASIITDPTNGSASLELVSDAVDAAGALRVTSNLYDTTNKVTSNLSYAASSDITNLSGLGISVNPDGSIALDITSLTSVLNSDYSGVQGLFQNVNSWGQTFADMLDNVGVNSTTGMLKMALKANSSIESTLNADISREELLISSESKSLTAELNSANEILQSIPQQLSSVNMLYSAITGYNSNS
jgi:flagellar hook-associated protein 2